MNATPQARAGSRPRRGGFTLLEVLLALVVAVGGIVAAGELVRLGMEEVDLARARSVAVLVARTQLAEYQAGFLVDDDQYAGQLAEDDPRQFAYQVIVEPLAEVRQALADTDRDLEALDRVTVIVSYTIAGRGHEYVLTEWVLRPETPEDEGLGGMGEGLEL